MSFLRYCEHKKVYRKKQDEEEDDEKDPDEINGDPRLLHVADHQLDIEFVTETN